MDLSTLLDTQMEQGYRSEVQERALIVSLQMFNLILERSVSLLKTQLDNEEEPRLIVGEDMQVLLPAIKIWCDWMLCHSTVWNPPPSCTDYRVGYYNPELGFLEGREEECSIPHRTSPSCGLCGFAYTSNDRSIEEEQEEEEEKSKCEKDKPPGDAWSRLATMANLLDKLNYTRTVLIQAKDAEGREDELELVKLPEDTTLAGFTPLMSNPQEPCYVEKTEDMDIAQVCLRISKVLFFGQVFLCGLETPVLKLQKNETGMSEYVSVVEASSISSPSSPPEQSDSELFVESYSEDENEPVSIMKRLPSNSDVLDDNGAPVALGEIRSLIERKEELERKQRKQDRHRQRVQVSSKKMVPPVEARDRLTD
ncbi:hypothetical protein M0802_004180 [Mischocyttarus mexicanus]|nr:hypothetical protein M0802_004180 [Mischocyttarus mexicanus]